MRNGASVWWPTPVAAERWFTEEERAASRRYHRPVERAAALRLAAHAIALAALVSYTRTVDLGVVGVVLLVELAIAIPRVVADAWHEFVHEPRFGIEPVRAWAFVVTSVGRMGLEAAGLALVHHWSASIDGSLPSVVLVGGVAFVVPLASALFGPRFVLAMHRATGVDPHHPSHAMASDRAAVFGVAAPRLVVLDPAAFDGVNAFATGTGHRVTVAVSERLLAAPPDLFRHVVGHEISHVHRHHLRWSALASGAAAAVVVAASVAISVELADTGSRLPLLVLLVGFFGLPLRVVLAWFSRVHERRADQDAIRTDSVSPQLLKQLHLSDRAALEPSLVGRLLSAHPPPAERLDMASRARRSSALAVDA